jgi:recombination protein RecT
MNPPANVNQDVQEATSALEKQQNSESMTITTLLQKRATKLYNDARAEEFMSSLMSATEKNPKIKQCSPSSIITAMTACIQLDLVPETSQQFAYLIPYSGMLQFQIGYKGLIELAYPLGRSAVYKRGACFSRR